MDRCVYKRFVKQQKPLANKIRILSPPFVPNSCQGEHGVARCTTSRTSRGNPMQQQRRWCSCEPPTSPSKLVPGISRHSTCAKCQFIKEFQSHRQDRAVLAEVTWLRYRGQPPVLGCPAEGDSEGSGTCSAIWDIYARCRAK